MEGGEGQERRRHQGQENPQNPAHDRGGGTDALEASRCAPLLGPGRRVDRQIAPAAMHGHRPGGSGPRRDGGVVRVCSRGVSGHDAESLPLPPENPRRALARDSRNGHSGNNKYKRRLMYIRQTNEQLYSTLIDAEGCSYTLPSDDVRACPDLRAWNCSAWDTNFMQMRVVDTATPRERCRQMLSRRASRRRAETMRGHEGRRSLLPTDSPAARP